MDRTTSCFNLPITDASNKRSLDWKPSFYPDLQSPDSPCVTLQWTYRDGVLVNLPAVLLVPGDIVLIRPSQPVHCRCLILAEDADETTRNVTLRVGDTFQPDVEGELEHPVGPKERESASPCRFMVLEAPFKVGLSGMSENEFANNLPLARSKPVAMKNCATQGKQSSWTRSFSQVVHDLSQQ